MNEKNMKTSVMSGVFWIFGERILAQCVSFVISVVLARLLLPDQYGIISMVLVFINIANVFVSNGLGESLIHRKDANETDFSTMFYCSLALGILLYTLLFFAAPYIAIFYHKDLLWVLRILALKIPVSSISTIQHAYVSKHMIFKKFFFSTLGGTFLSGILGIIMALNGFGVWALVFQYLTNTVVDTIVLFITVRWRPKFLFSAKAAKEMVGYGWKLIAASLINTTYNECRSLVIGRVYTASDLAFYNKGNQFPNLVITNIDTAIGKVVFPAMVQNNNSAEKMRHISRRAMKTTSFLIFPILTGLFFAADYIILLLFSEKWLPAVPFLRIACVYWACQPFQTTNWQIIKAMGRSDLCFKLEIVKKTIGVISIIISMRFGVLAVAMSAAVYGIISMIINILPNKKLIGYTLPTMMRDVAPSFFISLLMGGVLFVVSRLEFKAPIMLILMVVVGVLVYLVLAFITQNDSLFYLVETLGDMINKKRNSN